VDALERLCATAIPRSRAKTPYQLFERTHVASAGQRIDTSLADSPECIHPTPKES
jgi:hypothetical protein